MAYPKSWLPIFGEFSFEPELVRFRGGELPALDVSKIESGPRPRVGLAICDLWFGGGIISMSVESDHTDYIPAIQAVLYRDPATDERLTAGFSSHESFNNFSVNTFALRAEASGQQGWRMVDGAGTLMRERGRKYQLVVEQHASNIEIKIDGILVLRHHLRYLIATDSMWVVLPEKVRSARQGFQC
jgi:hypothetical protein